MKKEKERNHSCKI